ncbi:hypothetical protein KKH26_01440 [Patescibacteria group bacterium]|nr:hypothetical protein [Patescibacteria group bacterium]
MTDRAAFYGLTKEKIAPVTEQGDVAIIGGKPFPRDVAKKRKHLEEQIRREGFDQVMEARGRPHAGKRGRPVIHAKDDNQLWMIIREQTKPRKWKCAI